MKRVAFLINRTIKRYDNILGEIEYRCKDDLDAKFFSSSYPGHISEMAAEAVREGFEYIISVGGDGSINETLNGVLTQFQNGDGAKIEDYDLDGLKKVNLGLYPAGTGNDFSRSTGVKPDIRNLKESIFEDDVQQIDIGFASFISKRDKPAHRFYINITDVGMGGHTVQHMEKHRIKFLSANLNYMKAILSSFITYDKTRIRWTGGDIEWEGKVMSLVVANGRYFGSGLCIAPDARIDDGKFNIVTLGDVSMMDYIKNLRGVRAGKKIEHPEVSYHEVSSITIESIDGKKLPIDMDGEFAGYCPMTIQCIPGAVSFLKTYY